MVRPLRTGTATVDAGEVRDAGTDRADVPVAAPRLGREGLGLGRLCGRHLGRDAALLPDDGAAGGSHHNGHRVAARTTTLPEPGLSLRRAADRPFGSHAPRAHSGSGIRRTIPHGLDAALSSRAADRAPRGRQTRSDPDRPADPRAAMRAWPTSPGQPP